MYISHSPHNYRLRVVAMFMPLIAKVVYGLENKQIKGIDSEIHEDKRYLLDSTHSATGFASWQQFAACSSTCVRGYEKQMEDCCKTGDNRLCYSIPWNNLGNSIGTCTSAPATTTTQPTQQTRTVARVTTSKPQIKDCKDIKDNNIASITGDNVYLAHLNGHPVNILCDMTTLGGGWTVIMNRKNSYQNFEDQDYTSYAVGFGDLRANFWIGLENMYALTGDGRRYQLRVELTVANGTKYFETYDDFSVGPPQDFVLHIGKYHGNAGDSLSGHDGFGFTSKDMDHDSNTGVNCGVYLHGAWWFHNCYDSCLTCPYLTPGTKKCPSFSWNSLGYCIALKSARMMVRPM